MDVLHAAVCVIALGRQPEITLHRIVPGRGQLTHGETLLDQGPLEFEAQNHVQRISDFIRLDANIVTGDARDLRMQVICREGFLVGVPMEMLTDDRRKKTDELRAAANLQLHEQRLALVHRCAQRVPDRLLPPLCRQALLIERVTGLVTGRHERLDKA